MVHRIIILICLTLTSIMFGFNFGFRYGIKRGVDISMKTAIKETIKYLRIEFEKIDLGDQFKTIANKIFDGSKISLWDDDERKNEEDHEQA